MTRYPRGLSKRAAGWRISLGPGGSRFRKCFPPSTPYEDVEKELLKARQSSGAGKRTTADGSLAADMTRYLAAFMSTGAGKAERERHLKNWREGLETDLRRAQITREDVSRVLHQWKSAGLSAETCNKRRAALMAFFHALDGKGGINPVRDVPKFRVSPPLPRGLDYKLIEKALKQLRKSRTRARLKVMAYTGARPIQLRRLTPADWDDRLHTLMLHSTDKGRGTKPHLVPLSQKAQAAMREFENTDAWGKFASAPMARMWKKAATDVGLPEDVRPYDLRHSFGTAVYQATGDVRVTKDLLGHASLSMTERYTLAAIPERQRAAIAALDAKKPKKAKKRRKRVGN